MNDGLPEGAELSSVAATLDQLARRVAAMADAAVSDKREAVAADLIAVERALAGAVRRLERLIASHG